MNESIADVSRDYFFFKVLLPILGEEYPTETLQIG